MTAARMMPLPGWQGGDGNAAYLDKTLRHGPVEVYFDESITWRTIKERWFRAAVGSLVTFMILALLALTSLSSGMAAFAVFAAVVVFWLVFLLSKLDEPIGEWRVVLADRADVSDSVYSAIRGRLAERDLPLQDVIARRTYSRHGVSNRLVLVDGYYHVYVTVFPYGTSLYLGWTMWRRRRGVALVKRFVSDLVASLGGRLDSVDLMLRTEHPRAIREVVHALCREGLHVAVDRIEVAASYGFPNGLPRIEPLPGGNPMSPAFGSPTPADPSTGQAPWTAR